MSEKHLYGIINEIMEKGIRIGSREWGGYHSNSDIDFAMSHKDFTKILSRIKEPDTVREEYQYACKGHTMYNIQNFKLCIEDYPHVVNIITYDAKGMKKIEQLNYAMNQLKYTAVGKVIAERKANRIIIVEALLKVLFKKGGEKITDWERLF